MAVYVEGKGLAAEAEPIGLVTEGIAGIAVIVLAIIALSGTIPAVLASIVTIVVGVGLMVQAFNSAAEQSRMMVPGAAAMAGSELGGAVMVDLGCGVAGIVLGILALVGVNGAHLVPAALIVFGGAMLLSGAISATPRTYAETGAVGQQVVSYQGSAAASGIEILIGFAAIILGILSLIFMTNWVLTLVGFIAVGAALLIVSATVSSAVVRLFTRTA